MIVRYAVFPDPSERSMAIAEIGKPFGLIGPVRSPQLLAPASAFVLTQMCPPVGVIGPRPSVPAYITVENPFVSFGPPASSDRMRLTSDPVQPPSPRVSKLLVSTVNA